MGFIIGYIVIEIIPSSTNNNFLFIFFSGSIAVSAMILPGISGSFILLILGGTTLLLRNELFIKCKPTIVCWSCGLMFFGSHFVGSKLLIQRLNYGRFDFPLVVWEKLNTSWAIFCMLMGAINLYIIYNFNTDVWINFKLFGATAVTGIYMIAQLTYVTYYLKFPIRPFR